MVRSGCFGVSSQLLSGGTPLAVVSASTKGAAHVIETQNYSTLPYDVVVTGSIANGWLAYAAGASAWPAAPQFLAKLATVACGEGVVRAGGTGGETLCSNSLTTRLAGAPAWGPTSYPTDCTVCAVT
jgi:hypothetical protein